MTAPKPPTPAALAESALLSAQKCAPDSPEPWRRLLDLYTRHGMDEKRVTLLVLEEQRLCIVQRDRGGEQLLSVATCGIDDRLVDVPQVQSGPVANDLAVKRWIAVGESNGEAEHA